MVSGPLHETTPGSPATAIRIPVALCGVPGVKTKTSPRRSKGLDATTHRGLTESSGEVSLLDILSHRMSEMAIFRQSAAQLYCSLRTRNSLTFSEATSTATLTVRPFPEPLPVTGTRGASA
jgi:hypothetical protein